MDFPCSQFLLTCDGGQIQVSDQFARLVQGSTHYRWDTSDIRVIHYTMERQLAAVGELIHVLENGGDLVSSGREARKTLEIMLGMLRSHQEGNRRVDMSE